MQGQQPSPTPSSSSSPRRGTTTIMDSVLSTSSHNTCMICLCSLLRHPPLEEGQPEKDGALDGSGGSCCSSLGSEENEIGAVFPCGHCFHLNCWQQWNEKRCPNCNQDATLFCKIFISAPPLPQPQQSQQPTQPPLPTPPPPRPDPKPTEYVDVEPADAAATDAPPSARRQHQSDEEEEAEQRQILLDMRTATQAGPAETIRKVVSLRSKVRKLRRDSRETKSELESTRLVLQITQEELQYANQELETEKHKVQEAHGKLASLQTRHWERHKVLHDEMMEQHTREVKTLQKELQHTKAELTLRNRQLKHWAGSNTTASHRNHHAEEIPAVVHMRSSTSGRG